MAPHQVCAEPVLQAEQETLELQEAARGGAGAVLPGATRAKAKIVKWEAVEVELPLEVELVASTAEHQLQQELLESLEPAEKVVTIHQILEAPGARAVSVSAVLQVLHIAQQVSAACSSVVAAAAVAPVQAAVAAGESPAQVAPVVQAAQAAQVAQAVA